MRPEAVGIVTVSTDVVASVVVLFGGARPWIVHLFGTTTLRSRGTGAAKVHCTRARHVTKPRGVKTGTVHVSEGKALKVYPSIDCAARVTKAQPD
jgi:hypothetical protein